ncbi:MAG TPA: GTPase [Phycisphaerae bacterium]|nr:GTPase [Phycisphaerae bacterium]
MRGAKRSAFALLTPPGRGGIAVIRCTGPGVEGTLRACFRPTTDGAGLPPVGALAYGHIADADGAPIDEIILCHAACETYEVNCHGGPAAVAAACAALACLGLPQVDADALLEIEGVGPIERAARRLLRRATTPLAARILLDQLGGALGAAVRQARDDLAAGRADGAAEAIGRLLDRWRRCGRFLADPPRIVIAGRPNVGKSTLLNRLAGAERAITSEVPGTTRDYVEADAALAGLPVVLVDTAGLREAQGLVERLGVERAHEQAAGAALLLYLLDATEGVTAEDEAALARFSDRALVVWNKADAAAGPFGPPGALAVSALGGAGIEGLTEAVLAQLGYGATDPGEAVPFTGDQAEALARAQQLVAEAKIDAAREALASL